MKNMRRVFIIAALCILSATSAFAQSKDALKRAFDNGRFVEAKSMAEKLYAKHPDNSEYNYWYAACCIETGEIPDSIDVVKMLDFAVKRKIIKAHKYLGDWYFDKQRYDLATQNYKALVGKTKNKALREEAQRKHNVCARLDRMVCNSEVVCFIDSFIVDKEELLSVYSIGADAGLISTRAQYFGDDNLVGHINETQRGMDIYFSAESSRKVQISLDVINFGSVFSDSFGASYYTSKYRLSPLEIYDYTTDAEGNRTPKYRFVGAKVSQNDLLSRWRMQVGVRVVF